MNSAEFLPILYKADAAVLGGSTQAVAEALRRAQTGERVVLITRYAFLGTEICATLSYASGVTPDGFKKKLEEKCRAAGVRLLYQCQYLDTLPETDGTQTVRLAGKFGLAGVEACRVTDLRLEFEDKTYRAFLTNRAGDVKVLEVPVPETGNLARRLLAARKGILKAYRARYAGGDYLLGRFALRGGAVKRVSAERRMQPNARREILAHTGALMEDMYPTRGCSPVLEGAETRYDVVVAGGGTAGAMAAIAAARAGLRVALAEPNDALGGTGTVGGVSSYWFGCRYSDIRWVDRRVGECMDALSLGAHDGLWGKTDSWNPDIKATVLLEAALDAGVQVLLGHTVFGVWMEGGNVAGLAAVGADGVRFLAGDYLLDATGDGDVAVFAGADWEYGTGGDQLAYWASLAQYPTAGTYKNNFSAMMVPSDPVDATRFTVCARHYGGQLFDHGVFPCVRESRHIRGKYRLTLRDLMLHLPHPDTLYTCYSNYDPKGKVTADAVYCGLLPQQTLIEIPLSCLLPVDGQGKSIQHLYVLGKAISASHDVFPSIRMQPDLMHQGSILGSLIGRCVPLGLRPEALSPAALRELLTGLSDDPLSAPQQGTLTLEQSVAALDSHTRTHWVDMDFTGREEHFQPYAAVMCAESREVLPLLEVKLSRTEKTADRRMLIRCQLWQGDGRHLEEFLGMLAAGLAGDALPPRAGACTCAQLLPDHGVMPETVYDLNTLAWVRGDVSAPFERVYALLTGNPRDYHSLTAGIFPYVESFAYVAARNGSSRLLELTEKLTGLPELVSAENLPEEDLMKQRFLMLRYLLWSALARQGREAGYQGLVQCLQSPVLPLRLSAETVLCGLTGGPRGQTAARWQAWVDAHRGNLPVHPIREKVF